MNGGRTWKKYFITTKTHASFMQDLKPLYDAILTGDAKAAKSLTEAALAANVPPLTIVQEYMVPAMGEVGRRFECNEYFVPELLLAARAMKGALELIRPLLIASGAQPVGRVAVGTVKGDLARHRQEPRRRHARRRGL
jgi:5-methyltetrahydrofolate--homocysteine methyltransferase